MTRDETDEGRATEHVEQKPTKHHGAKQVLAWSFEAGRKMSSALLLIQHECTADEFATYRKGTGLVMGYLYTEIIRPSLHEHPDLTPDEMKGA